MNVLIVSTNRNLHPVPVMPIGACIVAEATEQAAHRVRLLDLMFHRNPLGVLQSELLSNKQDIVGLSIRNVDNNNMQSTVEFFKELAPIVDTIRRHTKATIVLGGPAISVMPEELLRYTETSWAVLGNGEVAFPKLLASFTAGDDPNQIPDIASLENNIFRKNPGYSFRSSSDCLAPDYNRWLNVGAYLSNLSTVPIQSKRGCPYKCIYCTYSICEGEKYLLCPPDSVVEAIKKLVSQGLRDIEFVDNIFNSPYTHAMAICEALAQVPQLGARLHSLEVNPRFVDDALLTAMEKAGFASIGITVESVNDTVLAGLGKNFTTEDIHKAALSVRRHNLTCLWVFMLGGPGETKASIRETLDFTKHCIRPNDMAFFNIGIRIYPGTKLEHIAREKGLLSLSPKELLTPVFYFSPTLDLDWLMNELRDTIATHTNHIIPDSVRRPFLPLICRLGYKLGMRPPLWKHTLSIRRGLKLVGVKL